MRQTLMYGTVRGPPAIVVLTAITCFLQSRPDLFDALKMFASLMSPMGILAGWIAAQ